MIGRRTLPVVLSVATLLAGSASAQEVARPAWAVDSLPTIGSDAEDRARLRQVLGADSATGWLVRSLSSRLRWKAAGGDTLAYGALAPELFLVHNSALPFSQNDGALWAGRGLSVRVRGGAVASLGPFRAVLMPEIAIARNDSFADVDVTRWHRPFVDGSRVSPFVSPWNQYPFSADVPVRFGDSPYVQVTLGQSAIWYERGALAAGVSSENLWWGPGVHDALVMTSNAAGVPHAFVRTARPLRTPVGELEGRLIIGQLHESEFFDYDASNDTRALSAAAATYRPRWEPDLVLGIARAVYAPAGGFGTVLGHALDVFGTFDRPGSRPELDSSFTGGREQLTSLFGRWVFPSVGWEVWGEVGRAERPASLRDLLTDPGHTRAYIVGAQHVRRVRPGSMLRVQVEFTQMEQSPSYRYRPTTSWYTSRATPQGYTQRGQVIGATIGPGSSHQWLAFDYVAPGWSAGAFAGRWRFNTDAMYGSIDFPPGTGFCEYDTTIYPGVRGSLRSRWLGLVQAEAIFGTRYNAFHQNNSGCPTPDTGRHLQDVRNRTIRITFAPRLPR